MAFVSSSAIALSSHYAYQFNKFSKYLPRINFAEDCIEPSATWKKWWKDMALDLPSHMS